MDQSDAVLLDALLSVAMTTDMPQNYLRQNFAKTTMKQPKLEQNWFLCMFLSTW